MNNDLIKGSLEWKLAQADSTPGVQALFSVIKARLPELEALLEEIKGGDEYGDTVYRFYHQSYKVYRAQEHTIQVTALLKSLMPDCALNEFYLQIVSDGTGRVFDKSVNGRWMEEVRPIVEAYFHAIYFLEMVVWCGRNMDEAVNLLPTPWAAVLHLYNLR